MSISSAKASYSQTLFNDDAWYDHVDCNDYADANYNSATDQYEVEAWSWLWVDGHARIFFDTANGGDYFSPSELGTANLRIMWYFDGHLSGSGNGYLRFTYSMHGPTSVTLSNSGVVTYSTTQDFTDDLEYHQFTTSTLAPGYSYYVDCGIHLFHDDGSQSDFYDGGNGLQLVRIQLWRN